MAVAWRTGMHALVGTCTVHVECGWLVQEKDTKAVQNEDFRFESKF